MSFQWKKRPARSWRRVWPPMAILQGLGGRFHVGAEFCFCGSRVGADSMAVAYPPRAGINRGGWVFSRCGTAGPGFELCRRNGSRPGRGWPVGWQEDTKERGEGWRGILGKQGPVGGNVDKKKKKQIGRLEGGPGLHFGSMVNTGQGGQPRPLLSCLNFRTMGRSLKPPMGAGPSASCRASFRCS